MAGQSERDFAFSALDRLHNPEEFAAVMMSRSRIFGGCFELRYRKRQSTSEGLAVAHARLGLIVPKRLAKRAVLRNLLKRLARESFRSAHAGLPPVDIVLRLAKPPLVAGQSVDREKRMVWRRSIDDLLAGVAR